MRRQSSSMTRAPALLVLECRLSGGGRVHRASIAEARVFETWRNFQEALKLTLAPLTEEQLGLRLRPDLRSVGEIAEHIAYGRALWLKNIQAESAADLEPLLAWAEP